jgi:hypothetical protein
MGLLGSLHCISSIKVQGLACLAVVEESAAMCKVRGCRRALCRFCHLTPKNAPRLQVCLHRRQRWWPGGNTGVCHSRLRVWCRLPEPQCSGLQSNVSGLGNNCSPRQPAGKYSTTQSVIRVVPILAWRFPRLTGRYVHLQVASMSTRRAGHTCEVLGSQMYIMGGYGRMSDGPSNALSTTEIYDARGKAWREGPDMRTPRVYGNSCVLDGQLYTFCGVTTVCRHSLFDHVCHLVSTLSGALLIAQIYLPRPFGLIVMSGACSSIVLVHQLGHIKLGIRGSLCATSQRNSPISPTHLGRNGESNMYV